MVPKDSSTSPPLGEAIRRGWRVMLQAYLPIVGSLGFMLLINLGVTFLRVGMGVVMPAVDFLIGIAAGLLLFPQVFTGLIYLTARATRGEATSPTHLFDAFHRFWSIAAITVFIWIIRLGLMIMIISGASLAATGDSLGNRIAGAIVVGMSAALLIQYSVRFAFAGLACVDPTQRTAGPIEALKRSWSMTHRCFWRLLGLHALLAAVFFGPVLPWAFAASSITDRSPPATILIVALGLLGGVALQLLLITPFVASSYGAAYAIAAEAGGGSDAHEKLASACSAES